MLVLAISFGTIRGFGGVTSCRQLLPGGQRRLDLRGSRFQRHALQPAESDHAGQREAARQGLLLHVPRKSAVRIRAHCFRGRPLRHERPLHRRAGRRRLPRFVDLPMDAARYRSVHPHRGAALANGKIIRGTGDDYLISLDAESGKLLWAKQIADPKEGFSSACRRS